jgi:hypothetical protein
MKKFKNEFGEVFTMSGRAAEKAASDPRFTAVEDTPSESPATPAPVIEAQPAKIEPAIVDSKPLVEETPKEEPVKPSKAVTGKKADAE